MAQARPKWAKSDFHWPSLFLIIQLSIPKRLQGMTRKKRAKIREQVWKMCKNFPSRQLTYTRHATRHSGKCLCWAAIWHLCFMSECIHFMSYSPNSSLTDKINTMSQWTKNVHTTATKIIRRWNALMSHWKKNVHATATKMDHRTAKKAITCYRF